MSFAARQRQLIDRLRWAPTRGPKREALLAELRRLVRDQLKQEMARPAAPQTSDLFGPPIHPSPPAEDDTRSRRREPYWMM